MYFTNKHNQNYRPNAITFSKTLEASKPSLGTFNGDLFASSSKTVGANELKRTQRKHTRRNKKLRD